MKYLITIICFIILASVPAAAQQLKLGDNPAAIDKSALLQLDSKNQGLLLPRISDTTLDPLPSAPDGMLIYYVGATDSCLLIRKDGNWVKVIDLKNMAATETDPVATAKTITANQGSGILITGTAGQTLGSSPTWTFKADTSLLATQYYVNSRGYLSSIDTSNIPLFFKKVRGEFSAGTGISYNSSTGVISAINNGTVTSVGLSLPSIFSVSGSPVTSSGTLTASLSSQAANKVFASPIGSSGTPSFTNMDSTYFGGSWFKEVRNDLSAGSGISYNSTTGVISLNYAAPVTSVNGQTGTVNLGLSNLSDATISSPSSGQLLQYNGTKWVNWTPNYLSSYTETDPVATAKTITANQGSGILITGTAGQTLGSSPTWTFKADTSLLATQYYVNSTVGSYWKLGGNSVSSVQNFGTTSNYDLPFITNNSERMRILASNGYIGIGNSNPNNLLTVNGQIEGMGLFDTAGAGNNALITLAYRSGGTAQIIPLNSADFVWQGGWGDALQMSAYHEIIFTGGTTSSSIPAFRTGNGAHYNTRIINTNTSTVGLTIEGVSGQTGDLQRWIVNGNTLDVVNSSGYVGINKTTASQALDVSGNVQFSGALMPNSTAGTSGQVLTSNGAGSAPTWQTPATGTVTSVGLSLPSIFSVSGSPVTSSGTLTASLASQTANYVFAAPNGSNGTPSFRALDTSDISNFYFKTRSELTGGSGINYTASTGIIKADTSLLATQYYVSKNFLTSSNISGTTNYIPVFTSSNSLGNSILKQSSGRLLINNPTDDGSTTLQVQGNGKINGTLQLASGASGDTLFANNSSGLTLESEGNTYGRVLLTMQNITGSNGAVFDVPDASSPAVVDFGFKTVNGQRNIRFETRSSYEKSGGPEFHIGGSDPDNPQLLVADSYSAFPGNLGIGSYGTPSYTLDVTGTGRFTDSLTLGNVLIANGSAGTSGQVLVSQGPGSSPKWQTNSSSGWSLTGNSSTSPGTNFLGTTDNNALEFKVNNTAAGYLGTTSNYETSLGVSSSVSNAYGTAIGASSNVYGNYGTALGYQASATTYATALGYKANVYGNYGVAMGDNASTTTQGVAIGYNANASSNYSMAIGSGSSASASNAIAIGYNTNAYNSNTLILGNGVNVGINTSSPGEKLEVDGNAFLKGNYKMYFIANSGSTRYVGAGRNNDFALVSNSSGDWLRIGSDNAQISFWTNGNADNNDNPQVYIGTDGKVNAAGYNTISDRRFKKDFHPLTNVLPAIDSLHGYTYYFRTNEFKDRSFPASQQIGMIAQEIEKYFPELVSTDSKGYKSLNYSQFTAVLLEAVKEQQTEIKNLQAENDRLKTELNNKMQLMEQKLDNLAKQVNDKK